MKFLFLSSHFIKCARQDVSLLFSETCVYLPFYYLSHPPCFFMNPLESSRGQARIAAMKFLYEREIRNNDPELVDNLTDYFTFHKIKDSIAGYARILIEGVVAHAEQIDTILKDNLKNWNINRLTGIDRNALRVGIYELVYAGDVPPKVTINEVVEICKQFGSGDSGSFANGVLDAVYQKLENTRRAGGQPDE